MKILRIKFVDFWADYNMAEGNFFYNLLKDSYNLVISDSPDFLFYSCYGTEHLNYNCTKIFFSAENWKPNYLACDYSISFEHTNHPKNLRVPLWVLYYHSYKTGLKIDLPNFATKTDEQLLAYWKTKTKFCCFIVSNDKCGVRNEFFKKLNKVKPVDSAGRYLNNIGRNLNGGTVEKFDFISDYKFVISFENEISSTYITEKIFEPMLVGAIPIYFGCNNLALDFNTKRVIYYNDYKNEDELINTILKIDCDDKLAINYLRQDYFSPNNYSLQKYCEQTKDFLIYIFDKKNHKNVSNNFFKKNVYLCQLKIASIKNKINHRFTAKSIN